MCAYGGDQLWEYWWDMRAYANRNVCYKLDKIHKYTQTRKRKRKRSRAQTKKRQTNIYDADNQEGTTDKQNRLRHKK